MVSSVIISPASPFPSDLPPLSLREAELLASLVELRFDLSAVAVRHNLPALDLIHWASSPSTRAHIRSLREGTDECTRIRQSQARRAAMDTLETIATTAADPIEKRRAASSILRSDQPRRVPRAEAEPPRPNTVDIVNYHDTPRADGMPNKHPIPPDVLARMTSGPSPDPRDWKPSREYKPLPKAHPNPAYSGVELVSRCAHDLLHPGHPHQAAVNLYSFLTPDSTVLGKPTPPDYVEFLRQQRLGPLMRIWEAYYHDVREVFCDQTSATLTVSFLTLINTVAPGLRIHLCRSDSGPHPNCWLITRIDSEHVPWRLPLPEREIPNPRPP